MKRFIRQWDDLWGEFRVRAPMGAVVFRVPLYPDVPLISPRFAHSIAAARRLEKKFAGGPLYLNCILPLDRSRKRVDAAMRRLGYACAADHRVKEFVKPRSLALPRGYAADVGTFEDRFVYRAYAEVTDRCFENGETFARKNRRLTAMMKRARTRLVVIRTAKGRPAAAGGVMIGKRTGLLFGGAVVPAHRRKGLWKALLALRQGLAREEGAEVCLLQTSNPHLFGAADRSRRLLTYRKRP